MKNFNQDDAFLRAKYKVKRIKRFYKHLAAYIIINALIFGMDIIKHVTHGGSLSDAIFGYNHNRLWLYWGIGLAFHAFAVFEADHLFGKNWEENKIKQFMKEEELNINSKN